MTLVPPPENPNVNTPDKATDTVEVKKVTLEQKTLSDLELEAVTYYIAIKDKSKVIKHARYSSIVGLEKLLESVSQLMERLDEFLLSFELELQKLVKVEGLSDEDSLKVLILMKLKENILEVILKQLETNKKLE